MKHEKYKTNISSENPDRKSIFELSHEELRERIRPTAERAKKESWDKGLYITYYDPKYCDLPDTYVHEYRDRKELWHVEENGASQFIKIL